MTKDWQADFEESLKNRMRSNNDALLRNEIPWIMDFIRERMSHAEVVREYTFMGGWDAGKEGLELEAALEVFKAQKDPVIDAPYEEKDFPL